MGIYQSAVENNQKFAIWGCGDYLNQVIDRIDPEIPILFVCDKDEKKWGMIVTNRKLLCVSIDKLKKLENIVVLIATKNKKISNEIKKELEINNILYCHINEALIAYRENYEAKQFEKYDVSIGNLSEPDEQNLLKYFISISVPVQTCQLKCQYCYIGQNSGFENDEIVLPSAEFICRALSRKRLGGTALINLCGAGETLLCKELFLIVRKLLEEGHYISIITNALISNEIKKYTELPTNLKEKLFFKCSFHYRQLKEKRLLNIYTENVKKLWESGMSISVEMVPEDELVPLIPEIKDFCLEHFGALPHITVARDESKTGMPIITDYNDEEYEAIWGQFHSPMFSFKKKQMIKRKEYCTAGRSTFLFSLESGDISPCPKEGVFYNLYNDISQKIKFKEVGYKCQDSYCRNGHAYLTLGMIKDINEYSYLQIRDRITIYGTHWVREKMANIFKQRICDNNSENKEDV